ncbi:MAG: porin family protein [Bacteroidota bacterium]
MNRTTPLSLLLIFLVFTGIKAQDDFDNKYLEDQFYIAFGYNFLFDKPDAVIQRNLSYNIQLGFIKDIPLNQKRNFGLGIGMGYATNSYYTNMLAIEQGEEIVYRLTNEDESFDRSKFETHGVEFPFEIRWRTSNSVDYKFWRIYAGFKLEYLFSRRSKLVAEDIEVFSGNTTFSNSNIEQWQYGVMLNFGYNTWNLHLYWTLSDFLDREARFENQVLTFTPLRIGVIFYIL